MTRRLEILPSIALFDAGDMICKRDESNHDLFILIDGVIGVYHDKKKVGEISKAGTTSGQLASVFTHKSLTFKAESEVVCLSPQS